MQGAGRKFLNDIILILALTLVGLSVFLFITLTREEGASVRVSVDSEAAGEFSLSEDGEYSLNGGTNILVIKNGEAYIKEATCPDGLCKKQGRISRAGERILCLPNRVAVEVLGESDFIER